MNKSHEHNVELKETPPAESRQYMWAGGNSQ